MLAQILRRLRACRRIDGIIVATSTNAADAAVVELARAEGVGHFCGSEHDVLGRFLGAARAAEAAIVVRITADCPLIDPDTVDRVVQTLEDGGCDYASNVIERTYPRGLDTEAFFRDVLERVARLAQSPQAREHVTWFLLRERPELFVTRSLTHHEDHSDLRWTVDTPEDLALARRIYEELHLGERLTGYEEIVAYVLAHPELAAINAGVEQKIC